MGESFDIIIIGGGIIGLSAAYHISKKCGAKILVIERNRLGEGSTGRCAGGIRTQFATEINILFSINSLESYEHFQDEFDIDIGFKQHGYLFMAATPEEDLQFRENCALQQSYGISVEYLTQAELKRKWSFLNVEDLSCATFCERDGYAGPYEAVQGFYRKGRENGVQYRENEEVIAIETEKGRITGIRTASNHYCTATVLNAGGPQAAVVGKMAGVDIPVAPYRRQLFFAFPRRGADSLPEAAALPLFVDYHRGWYFRREGNGFLISGSQDRHSSFDTHTDYEAMSFACEHALHRVPALSSCEIQGGWGGSYDMTPDCHAIIGEAEEVRGFYLACGFSGHGFMHAPSAGKVISELIVEGSARTIEIAPLSPDRFKRGALNYEPMTVFKRGAPKD